MGPDFDVLRRAYLTPLQNPMAGVRIFWPFMVPYEIGSQFYSYKASTPANAGYALAAFFVTVGMLIAWLLFAAGAIRWHRWLVVGEQPARLSLALGGRLRPYFARTFALAVLGIAVVGVLLLFGWITPTALGWPPLEEKTAARAVSVLAVAGVLLVDVLVAFLLARFVLALPILAIEPIGGSHLRELRRAQNGFSGTLLGATLPLTCLWCLFAYGMPKLTPDASDDPNFVMPTWAIAIDAFDTLMLDALYFYVALVFLSALSFWYAKHERARLLSGTPA